MDVEELFEKLKPVLGGRIEKLWWEYRLNPDSRPDIEAVLRSLAAKHLGQTVGMKPVLLPPPAPEVAAGEYRLGTVRYPGVDRCPFGLRESEWVQHAAVFGRTGAGKTNVGFLVLRELQKHKKPFLVLDWKRNYRDLLTLPEFDDLRVFTVGRSVAPFTFNPLAPPPGTQPTVWLKKLIEIICHVYWLGEGVAYLLQRALDAEYESSAREGQVPTLAAVKTWLENRKTKGREAQWMESTLRALGALCYGEIGRVVNSERDTDLRPLLGQRVVLELDALTESDKAFLGEALLLWIHHYRLQEGHRETFKHAVLIEEAHHVLLKRKQSKETVMDVVFREIRELGESLILFDQHPSLVSIPSLGNTYCTIAMNLKHGSDVRAIGDAMLLSEEQREYLGRLEVGQGIVRLQGRWHEPFLVGFPLLEVKKGSVTDEALSVQMGADSGSSADRHCDEDGAGEILPIRPRDKGRDDERIGADEREFLEDVITHPTASVSERFRRLGWSVESGYKRLNSLCSVGLLMSDRIATPTGAVRFVHLSQAGADRMRLLGFDVPVSRNESPEHLYWKLRIAEGLERRGYRVAVEARSENGRTVDILASRGLECTVFEIETGSSLTRERLGEMLADDLERTVWVTVGRKAFVRLRRLISACHPEAASRARILTVTDALSLMENMSGDRSA